MNIKKKRRLIKLRRPLKRVKKLPADHRDELIRNGLQFVKRGVDELWAKKDKNHLKHSVINFYSGVELLLKARLMHEHWALIVKDIRKADAEKFIEGDFQSVGLSEIIQRLRKISELKVSPVAEKCFDELRTHRNQMVHFFHTIDKRTKEGRALKDQIIKEQCQGWFLLRDLISNSWKSEFTNFQTDIERIDGQMRPHKEYLRAVFEQVKGGLEKERDGGASLGRCYSCGFDAHVIKLLGPSENICRVCGNTASFVRHQCNECETLFLFEEGSNDVICPECGEQEDLSAVMDQYTEEGQMIPAEALIDGGYGHCDECEGYETVGTVGERYFCFNCFSWHESMGTCDWCGSKSTGDLEFSGLSGCVACEGRVGYEGD